MVDIEFDGETFHFDMEEVTTVQLFKMQQVYPDMTILALSKGMQEGDIRALVCVYWLMQIQAGNDRTRLESVQIKNPVKFASALMVAIYQERLALVEAAEKALAEDKDPKE